ncbi:MAG: T9SS type A sorting domain-containing protein [Elusimicrobiota bacterium]
MTFRKAGLLLAAAFLTALGSLCAAVLTGGSFRIPLIAGTSGGGSRPSQGRFRIASSGTGQWGGGSRMSGGQFAMQGGFASAAAPVVSAADDLSGAHAFPVPFRPYRGHAKITFTGLTRDAEVRVYTISGRLVKTLIKSGAGNSVEWNVTNERGEGLASGVYLYVIKAAGAVKSGKLMVIK